MNDPLRAARGIARGLALGIATWALLALFVAAIYFNVHV